MIGIGDKWEQPLHNAHEVQSSYGKPSWARLSDSGGGAWKRHTYREWQVTVERTRPTVRTWLGDSPGGGGGPELSSAEDSATVGAIYQEWRVTVERTRPTMRTRLRVSPV